MDTTKIHHIDKDAFSSGQIGSKIWLCENLEKSGLQSLETALYGGWYGLTAFLLFSRGKFPVDKIRSYDIDPTCEQVADMLNENWVWQNWKFKAHTKDCNQLYTNADLIINTSTEHFETLDWWNNIKSGTKVALQSNNMPHSDHVFCFQTLQDFTNKFVIKETIYAGQLDFRYESWSFSRFMIIGIK